MPEPTKYKYMSRKELAAAAGVNERTLYSYIQTIWPELEARGCRGRKRITPSGVEYICQHFGISV